MEWEFIAPMIMSVVFILTVGGVLVLRPLSKRLADLLEVMVQNRQEPRIEDELLHMRELMETMTGRLSLLEERQDFTERLLSEKSSSPGSDTGPS
jgi:hypothetical protein